MWPCKNNGEDSRLFRAVSAASRLAIELGINIPTGKDSLSMTQKYPDQTVLAPGSVIITAAGEVENIRGIVEPIIVNDPYTRAHTFFMRSASVIETDRLHKTDANFR